jgi:hypothetical protein
MTGVESVSNGVQAFREKIVDNARTTLTIIIAILILMLLGIAWLVHAYGIAATEPGSPQYQSVLSQVIGAIWGRGALYYVSIGSILLVLSLSANTSFAGFPRVCHAVAENRYLPWGFTMRGRRLVYTQGIYVLAMLSAILLIIFGGVTDRLIPLFAVGAFLAFTLSQAGMVMHWRKQKQRARWSEAINGIGAVATGITVIIVILAKFTEGAWITLILIPLLVGSMLAIGKHYRVVGQEIEEPDPLALSDLKPPLAIVPMDSWNRVTHKALRFAMTISPDVEAVHIAADEKSNPLSQRWGDLVEKPSAEQGRTPPKLVVLESPYRLVVSPIVHYALAQAKSQPDRKVAVVVAELREPRWYQFFLHNQRDQALTALLLLNGSPGLTVINVPWYVDYESARTS